jgi:hypothetical protein
MTLASSTLDLAGSNMDLRPGADGSGLVAFLVVAALVVACVFLYRSMRKQLGKIDFEPPSPPDRPANRESSADDASAESSADDASA